MQELFVFFAIQLNEIKNKCLYVMYEINEQGSKEQYIIILILIRIYKYITYLESVSSSSSRQARFRVVLTLLLTFLSEHSLLVDRNDLNKNYCQFNQIH